jgi:hypothetical protein
MPTQTFGCGVTAAAAAAVSKSGQAHDTVQHGEMFESDVGIVRIPQDRGCGLFLSDLAESSPVKKTSSVAFDRVASRGWQRNDRSLWGDLALAAATLTLFVTTLAKLLGAPRFIRNVFPPEIGSILASNNKVWLFSVWICLALSVLIGLTIDRLRANRLPQWMRTATTLLAVVGLGLTFVFATWQNPPYPPLPQLWTGFGYQAAIIGALMAVVAIAVVRYSSGSNRALLLASVTVVAFLAIPSLLQTPATFESGYDNTFTFDEILAPANGRVPGFDYVNQYGSLLGYPLALLSLLARPLFLARPESFAVGWLVFLQVATLVGAVATVIRVSPRALRWLAPLTVIPVAFLVGAEGLPYYADLPIRVVVPVALLGTFVFLGLRTIRRGTQWWTPGLLGLVGGVAAFNNLDFGVPALLAGLVALLVPSQGVTQAIARVGIYLAGAASFVSLYLIFGWLSGHTYHPEYSFFFVQSFGVVGVNNVDLTTVGLHDAFVVVGIIGAVLGALGARRLTKRNAILYQAILYQSTWMLLSLAYFSGRSLTPTLITGSALQAGILLSLLVAAGVPYLRLLLRSGIRSWSRADAMTAILILLALALPLAAWTTFPSVQRATERLSHALQTSGTPGYLEPSPGVALKSVPQSLRVIGVVGVAGNVWSPRLGVTNANLFLHPAYLRFPGAADMECNYLKGLPGDVVVTTRPWITALQQSRICRDVVDFGSIVPLTPETPQLGMNWVRISRK